jgi:hypothetical protein
MKQRRKHWGNQAIFVLQRILQHYNIFPNFFVVDTFYDALLKGYNTNKLTAEKALDNAMVLIEIFELQITKEEDFVNERFCRNSKSSIPQRVFQQTNGWSQILCNFTCFSYDIIYVYVVKRKLPEIEARELAEFMHTYIETYESSLPTCLVFHPPDFAILKSIVNDRLFFYQEWITRLNDFLNPGVRPLNCIAASEFKKLDLKEEELEKLPKVLLQVFFHH